MAYFKIEVEIESYTKQDIEEYLKKLNFRNKFTFDMVLTDKGTYLGFKHKELNPSHVKVVFQFKAYSEGHARVIAGLLNSGKIKLEDIHK